MALFGIRIGLFLILMFVLNACKPLQSDLSNSDDLESSESTPHILPPCSSFKDGSAGLPHKVHLGVH